MKHEDQIEFYTCPICGEGTGNDVDGSEEHKCPEEKQYDKTMTSLTDKMEGLMRDTPNEFDIGSERSTPKIIRDNGFNQAVNECIALAKAEDSSSNPTSV